ncbi:MAG: hypothetical protein ABJA98_35740 [Acidobacteriota bacterium]
MNTGRWLEAKSAPRVLAVALSAGLLCLGAVTRAQTPARGASQTPARGTAAPAGGGAARASTSKVDANLLQLMRGILYPASNVLFAAQDDLSKLTPVADPSVSPNPLTSTYGGWQAVENAGLAIAESANLIAIPGRLCSNGKPVPVQRADWVKYTQGLRTAGLAAYKAAQSKDQDKIVEVAGSVSDACAACHDVYREKKNGDQDRCLP